MTYNKKTIEDVDVAGKKVLVRCDFNVPLKDGVITSDKRIVEAIPTIKYLLEKNAKVNFQDSVTGNTILYLSLKNKMTDISLALIQKGAYIDRKSLNYINRRKLQSLLE